MRSRHTLVLSLALLFAGTAEAADPAAQTAKEHFVRGTQLYDLQRFDDAAKEYEAAYQMKSDPALLFNIGQAHRQAKHWELAEGAFRSYLRNVPRAANRARVEQMMVDIHLAATEEKKLADEQARKDADLKAEEAKRATAEAERQRAIAEAQARTAEARERRPHADPAAAARGRKLRSCPV